MGVESAALVFWCKVICVSQGPLQLVVIGHSLGGLILRAALPKILESSPRILVPTSYVSLQTPHLGCRKPMGGVGSKLYRGLTNIILPLLAGMIHMCVCVSTPTGN